MESCDGHGCHAVIEWHCEHAGLVRVFDGTKDYGDAYCYALPFVVRELFAEWDKDSRQGLIEFIGVTTVMRPCQYRAMREVVRQQHYGILSTRIKGGVAKTIEVGRRRR